MAQVKDVTLPPALLVIRMGTDRLRRATVTAAMDQLVDVDAARGVAVEVAPQRAPKIRAGRRHFAVLSFFSEVLETK